MKISDETRELVLKECEKLKEAGVQIRIGYRTSSKEEKGFARLEGSSVSLLICDSDPMDVTISNIVEAGELVNEALKVKNHERNHPNLFVALANRYGYR